MIYIRTIDNSWLIFTNQQRIINSTYVYHKYSLFWWWSWIALMREFWQTSPDFPFRLLIEFSFPSILMPNLAYLPTSHWAPPNDFLYRDTTWYHRQQPAVQQQIQLCQQLHQDFKVHPAQIPPPQTQSTRAVELKKELNISSNIFDKSSLPTRRDHYDYTLCWLYDCHRLIDYSNIRSCADLWNQEYKNKP
jgi:hypothetical protein